MRSIMNILLQKSIIDIKELEELKKSNNITYNSNIPDIDLVITDEVLYFKNYKDYSIKYSQWLEKGSLAFVVSVLEDTLSELNSYNF